MGETVRGKNGSRVSGKPGAGLRKQSQREGEIRTCPTLGFEDGGRGHKPRNVGGP